MADCSKTLEYENERNRHCNYNKKNCDVCIFESNGYNCEEITQKHIDLLQAWSDSHPKKTRQSEFVKIYPNVEIETEYGFVNIAPCTLDERLYNCGDGKNCDECCKKFWLEEIE